jgi:hypothetical protein
MFILDIFKDFFATKPPIPITEINVGRFSDSYKPQEQKQMWEHAIERFNHADPIASFTYFFEYLKNLDEPTNISYTPLETDGKKSIEFTIYQGSKKLLGICDTEHLEAEVELAYNEQYSIGLLRRLLEENNNLQYSKYAVKPNNRISLKFDTNAIDANPYKLYFGLKELACVSDRMDDQMRHLFKNLQIIEHDLKAYYSPEISQIKFQHFQAILKQTIALYHKYEMAIDQYPKLGAYLFLNTAYTLDYLIQPEGHVAEVFETIHTRYHTTTAEALPQTNNLAFNLITELLDFSATDFYYESYHSIHTFGLPTPGPFQLVKDNIHAELPHIEHLYSIGHTELATMGLSYTISFHLFNHAMPKPIVELMRLYIKNLNPNYFSSLGETHDIFIKPTGFDPKIFKKAVIRIQDKYKKSFPNLHINPNPIRFEDSFGFSRQYVDRILTMTI